VKPGVNLWSRVLIYNRPIEREGVSVGHGGLSAVSISYELLVEEEEDYRQGSALYVCLSFELARYIVHCGSISQACGLQGIA